MATAYADRTILVHLIDSRDEHNAPDTLTIRVTDASSGDELRYLVGRERRGINSGRPFDVESFDTAEAAESYADELASWSREELQLEATERREARAQALRDLVAGWYRDDPAREIVEACAEAIEKGLEPDVIAALATHDPMPRRRGSPLNGLPRRRQADSCPNDLNDLDVITATGCCG
ncbi:hypothetical protein [Singulisphaera sp. PoT]|uniref:hypothetical protein n=1 Tax=Singulisphaera sp. PoT TaxID=3411797 RepID=UPI003BF4F2CF